MTWSPTIIESIWGYYQIIIGNVDVTYYRDVVTKASRLTWAEPFGPATAEITLPQITPFELKPSWMTYGALVDVWHVDENFNRVGQFPMWEGILIATAAGNDENTYGLTASCIGAMFHLDFYKKKPDIGRGWKNTDIGISIPDEINQITRMNTVKMYFVHPQNTGILTRSRGGWDPLLTGWIQDLLATATTEDGGQWTMNCVGRAPFMLLKDMGTIHWNVMNATPGVLVNLEEDATQVKNVFYGEGIDDENCRWRNQKFPYLRNGMAPVFPGRIISVGVSGSDVVQWKDEMRRSGYSCTPGDTYNSDDSDICRVMQSRAGIQVDGVVGPQTWAATFESGSLVEDVTSAIFLPMAWRDEVEPLLYNAGGSPIGPNPTFDPNILRMEEYQNLGDRISFSEGVRSFKEQWTRYVGPSYAGTITLSVDPEAGSRWDMRQGQNIVVRQYRGLSVLKLHIAGCEADLDAGTVTLTVDEKNRDMMTLAAVLERKRDTTDPVKREVNYFRSSRVIPDRMSTWDCENGSGIYPRQGTYNGLWNVTRIPMSEGGTIVRTRFTLDIASPFGVAVFDRPITANDLAAIGTPLDPGFYELEESGFDSDVLGCLIAWGQDGDAAGYYPKREGDADLPLPTGVLQDDGSWEFSSQFPPWVWVAVWVQEPKVNYIQGQFYLSVSNE